ncbi:YdcF family protein [Pseudonocardia sp. EV170527-09]|uniref:YdcF family protein n=1 Tax=Pseudonocardia sp. EV170527-09 TaxID=2603411 RepID=UPI0011F2A42A|nr:YdcF family protein [Pseudonocardia sp. EV170527-09]KAA1020239.1 YdcF family protein [Pseudonocardia sp. EV170527-09]
MPNTTIPAEFRADVETLWEFNQMHHELRPVDLGIGLGSHDLGVATYTAELYHQGYFPRIVFTGANAPTTIERFPRGEAVHYREHALSLGVPDEAILVEPNATNTGENIDFTRALVEGGEPPVRSVMLISRPYQQRRAFAMCHLRWPSVLTICTSRPSSIDEYVSELGDSNRVISMLVGDTQRLWEYARKGWAIEQDIPADIQDAYDNLVAVGYTSRVLVE